MSGTHPWRNRPRSLPGLWFLFVLVLSWVPAASVLHAAQKLHVSWINVGQGDSILIRVPAGRTILIDAGDDAWDAGKKVYAYLKSLGVERIDTFILTHPHDDHFGGLYYLCGKVKIRRFLYGTRISNTRYARLERLLKEHGVPMEHIDAGYVVETGNPKAKMEVYHSGPPELQRPAGMRGTLATLDHDLISLWPIRASSSDGSSSSGVDLNSLSIVSRLTYGSVSFLFTGDMTRDVEERLLREGYELSSIVYKAAHHGSQFSNTMPLLTAVNPTYVIIQSGEGNPFGHPHPQALERFRAVARYVYRNDERGTIQCWTDGEEIDFKDELGSIAFLANPRVVRLNPKAVTVSVKATKSCRAEVRFRKRGTARWRLVSSDIRKNAHKLVLSTLKPDTQYEYKVTIISHDNESDRAEYSGSFRTRPLSPDDESSNVRLGKISMSHTPVFVKEPVRVEATVGNAGETALQARFEVYEEAMLPNARIHSSEIELPAGGATRTSLVWVPRSASSDTLIICVKKGRKVMAVRTLKLPLQRRVILFDGSHRNWVVTSHRLGSFYSSLEEEGYEVREHTEGPLTEKTLSGVHVLFLPWTTYRYSHEEKEALTSFLENGGGVVLTSKGDYSKYHDTASFNSILSYVGSAIRFNDDEVLDDTDNYGNTPARAWVPKIHVFPRKLPGFDEAKIRTVISHGTCSLLDLGGGPLGSSHPSGVMLLLAGDDDTYNIDADKQGDYVQIAPGSGGLIMEAAERIGAGRLLVCGGTHFTDREYTDDTGSHHQTPRYNLVLMAWLSGRTEAVKRVRTGGAPRRARASGNTARRSLFRKLYEGIADW